MSNHRRARRPLRAQIARWRDNVIDLDVLVDDCRRTVDRDVEVLREAVRERDGAAVHLAHLIGLHNDEAAAL